MRYCSVEKPQVLLTLQKSYKEKIKDVLRTLKGNPFSYPYRKIRGKAKVYRICVGKYRILHKVEETKKMISIKG